jgi:hypothetical protein
MAEAINQHTRIEFTPDEYLHHVRMVWGCGINRGLSQMERLLATGPLLLILREYDADGNQIGDAIQIGGRDFSMNYNLRVDMNDHVRVVLRTFRSPFTHIKIDSSDPDWPVVERINYYPSGLVDYTVVEQDVRPSRSPAALPASDRQLEDKAGLDPLKVDAGRAALPATDLPKPLSTIVWITAEARQLKADDKITKGMSKTELAKLLANQSQGAAKADKLKKPLTLRYIRNQLEAWDLWPISSIK